MLILHPDVINLSLGWTAGMDNEADTVYATVYKKLQDAGITVNAAAGKRLLHRVRQQLRQGPALRLGPRLLGHRRARDLLLGGRRSPPSRTRSIRNAFTVNGRISATSARAA